MTRQYILISEKTPGFIALGYNPAGYLVEWRMCCWQLSDAGLRALLEKMGNFLHYNLTKQYVAENGEMRLILVENDLSFDRFWALYGMKRNVDKARPIWERMKPQERQYIIWNMEAYHRYIQRMNTPKPWYNQMYPDTYLRSHTQDDWDKIEKPNNEFSR